MQDTIIQGDSYELIKTIPDKSVDLIVTDPHRMSLRKTNGSAIRKDM